MESQKNTTVIMSKEEEDKIKQDLSNKVNIEAIQIVKNETDINIAMDALNNQINIGSKEFSLDFGTQMTYAEMRQMWG